MEPEPDLAERYRGPGRAQRLVALVVVATLVVSGVGLLTWTVIFQSNPSVRSDLTAFTVPDDHRAVATITVARASRSTKATCRLRALAADYTVVGEVDRRVFDGPAEQTLRVELRTERRATAVDLVGCTTPDQPRPS